MNVLIIGATGLCGSAFLRYAAADKTNFKKIHVLARRSIPNVSQLETIAGAGRIEYHIFDSNEWVEHIPDGIDVLFSALGITRAAAGGLTNQYKVDHDLNVNVARVAKKKGCKMMILVSSVGASCDSRLPYFKMKGEVERDINGLSFDKTFILRPSALLGDRGDITAYPKDLGNIGNPKHKSWGNSFAARVGTLLYGTWFEALLGYPVYGDEVARVSVKLATDTFNSTNDEEDNANGTNHNNGDVRIVSSSEIVEIARSLPDFHQE